MKHRGPDSLTRCLREDDNSERNEEDVEDAIYADLAALRGEAERDNEHVEAAGDEEAEIKREEEHEEAIENDLLDNDIPEEFHRIIYYLKDFEHSKGLTCKKYLQF